jgi:hypothetical protein
MHIYDIFLKQLLSYFLKEGKQNLDGKWVMYIHITAPGEMTQPAYCKLAFFMVSFQWTE